jgi:flagellar export protein FliJ
MAKRFVFRLEAVQKVRQRKLDEARRVVADRQRRILRIRHRIDACRHGIAIAVGDSRAAQREGRPDVIEIRRYRSYMGAMHRAIADAELEMAQEKERLRAEQEQLSDANKEVKAIEKLRERQWERHCQEQNRADRVESDEIALQLYRRMRANAG